eukprot:1654330-Heterocapsa_arctica.AAC.1
MEWDQRTLDMVTSNKTNITNNIILRPNGQVPAWTTWYSQPPMTSRDTTSANRLITFGILTTTQRNIIYLRPWE